MDAISLLLPTVFALLFPSVCSLSCLNYRSLDDWVLFNCKFKALERVNTSTATVNRYKSLYLLITLLFIEQMAKLHLFLCGVMKGIFNISERIL